MDLTAPGVKVQERDSGLGSVAGVGVSACAFVGSTPFGPTDSPMLVTSFDEFERNFGAQNDPMSLQLSRYFGNGGRQAHIVRVIADDAVKASGSLTTSFLQDSGVNGNGTTGAFALNATKIPLKPGTVNVKSSGTRATGTITTVAVATLAGDANGGTFTLHDGVAARIFEFRTSGVPTGNNVLVDLATGTPSTASQVRDRIINAINGLTDFGITAVSGGPTSVALTNLTAGTAGNQSSSDTVADAGFVVSAMANGVAVKSYTDNGSGGWGGGASGTVDYTTGAISITTGVAVAASEDILIEAEAIMFDLELGWAGLGGNDMVLQVAGDPEYLTDAEARYTRFIVSVIRRADFGGTMEDVVLQRFAGIVFDDPASQDYVVTRLHDVLQGTPHFRLTSNDVDENPGQLAGTAVGPLAVLPSPLHDDSVKAFTFKLRSTIQPGSLELTLSTGEVVTDDSLGGLTVTGGSATLNVAGTNSVDYDAGTVVLTWNDATATAVTVSAEWRTELPDAVIRSTMAGGTNGGAVSRSVVTDAALSGSSRGIYALNSVQDAIQIVIPAFATDAQAIRDVFDLAESRKDRFLVYSPPSGLTAAQAVQWFKRTLNRQSYFGACYFPHEVVLNPWTRAASTIPAVGAIAGAYARTDNAKTVAKVAAGVEDGVLRGTIRLERSLNETEVGILNVARVNALIDWQGTGLAIWGARTGKAGDFGYINQRRTMNFLELSVKNAAFIYVFENTGPALWFRITGAISSFLSGQWRQGVLKGESQAEAFFVKCNESNNPPEVQNAGQVQVEIGVALQTPGEFVIITFRRKLEQ